MQLYTVEIVCDRCGATILPENNHLMRLNTREYDLCAICSRNVSTDIEEFIDTIIDGSRHTAWSFRPFAHPEGRPAE